MIVHLLYAPGGHTLMTAPAASYRLQARVHLGMQVAVSVPFISGQCCPLQPCTIPWPSAWGLYNSGV